VQECIVCAARTWSRVLVVHHGESIPLCSSRCRQLFLRDPVVYLGAEMAGLDAHLWSPRSARSRA
jgi:hypothetical protein